MKVIMEYDAIYVVDGPDSERWYIPEDIARFLATHGGRLALGAALVELSRLKDIARQKKIADLEGELAKLRGQGDASQA